jgi:hopanoid biosynthesis associated protein HpnK
MKRLIVNADDFGLGPGVNEAVRIARREGILTSASIMVNEPGAEEAAAIARGLPGLGVGLHLVLSSGRAATRAPELVNADGRFRRNSPLLGFRYFVRRSLQCRIESEIRAQIAKLASLGVRADHLNGHKDLHVHPTVFPLVAALAKEAGIPGVRLLDPEQPAHRPIDAVLSSFWNRSGRKLLRRAGLLAPDRVFGNALRITRDSILRLLERLPDGDSELYVHPSTDREAGHKELAALTDSSVRAAVKDLGIGLITYREMISGPVNRGREAEGKG